MGKAEAVYDQLRAEIESMRLPPGSKLSEVTLGERLGASRTPVREAIRRLAREGLVTFTPGEIAAVAPISLRGVRELFAFRMILEPAAARMVALDGIAAPALLAPFRQIAVELDEVAGLLDEAPDDQVADTFYGLAERFDQAVIAACGNAPLAATIANTRGQTVRLRGIAHSDPARMRRSVEEHRRMCEAVLQGDPDGAARELSQHLSETLRTIVDGLTAEVNRPGGLDITIVPSA